MCWLISFDIMTATIVTVRKGFCMKKIKDKLINAEFNASDDGCISWHIMLWMINILNILKLDKFNLMNSNLTKSEDKHWHKMLMKEGNHRQNSQSVM